MADGIEMFRDMSLTVPPGMIAALRTALIEAAVAPWHFDAERADEIKRNAVSSEDVLLFQHEASDRYPSCLRSFGFATDFCLKAAASSTLKHNPK